MKAIVIHEFGGPEVMKFEEFPMPAAGPGEVVVEVHAVSVNRTLDLILRAGGFAAVVLDLSGVPARALGGLPLTTWLRLGRSVEGSRTAALVGADAPVARSAGGASLELQPAPARWRGTSVRIFEGPSIAPRMRGFRKALP